MRLHPATLFLAWIALVLALQRLPLPMLSVAMALALAFAFALARGRIRILLRRTRWLMLSIFLLFAFASPGELLFPPFGAMGVTWDGLIQAGEHLSHLVLMLSTLALLHEGLGTAGMVAGLHALLRPLSLWHDLRERIVVRLMLVLDHVESGGGAARGWRSWLDEETFAAGPDRLALATARWGWADALCLLAAAALLGALWS